MEEGLKMFVYEPLYQADVLRVHRGHGAVVRAAMHGEAGESHFCFSIDNETIECPLLFIDS